MKKFFSQSQEGLQILIEEMVDLLDFDVIQLKGHEELDHNWTVVHEHLDRKDKFRIFNFKQKISKA